jgi:hypothetical protein
VRFAKPSLACIVTRQAEEFLLLGKQIIMVRTVRAVTGPASFLPDNRMDDFPLERLLSVALEAGLRTFRL